jgi:drug/metabolite transporter (DMT)-like permease
MNVKIKGSLCGIAAAVAYGLNPLGVLKLYNDDINMDSVIFYRYGLAMIVLVGITLLQNKSFKIGRKELLLCLLLGFIFAVSTITFFKSFYYMESGVACTLLFVYPLMVAVIMALFFKERLTIAARLSILTAMAGIGLLYKGEEMALSAIGILLVMLSSLAYALYIIIINRAGLSLSAVTLTFYVMLFGMLTIILHSFITAEYHLQLLTSARQWLWALMLALIPTVLSLVLMAVAIKNIGSTPTAVMGALEPVTAVAIGVAVFDESFTLRIAAGILLILLAVSVIIAEKSLIRARFFMRPSSRSRCEGKYAEADEL